MKDKYGRRIIEGLYVHISNIKKDAKLIYVKPCQDNTIIIDDGCSMVHPDKSRMSRKFARELIPLQSSVESFRFALSKLEE